MRCSRCQKQKLSYAFTSLRRVGNGENGQDLNRYCLRCLQTEIVSETGRFHQQTDIGIISHLQNEIDYLDGVKVHKGRYELEWEKANANILTVSFLGGDSIAMPVTAQTRIKDIKVFLGQSQGLDPRGYRILFGDQELKVKQDNGQPYFLFDFGEVREVSAIRPYGQYAGQSRIEGAARDRFGNADGNTFDLGRDGAFGGLTILVLQFYFMEFDFLLPKAALEQKGFTVVHWQVIPSTDELREALQHACQLWVISSRTQSLSPVQLDLIEEFYERGRGLYLWGDNCPFYAEANAILAKLFPGEAVRLEGNDNGTKILTRTTSDGVGFDSEHFVFTGIENLYEGITISRVLSPTTSLIAAIAVSSHGYPVTCALDDGTHRLAIDGGYTRLFPNYWEVTAGTSRFVKNISAWLCGFEVDWIED